MSDSWQPYGQVTPQAPLSMGFSRQEYWSGLPFPSPGDLPNPGIEPKSRKSPPLSGRFFTTSATWEALPGYEALNKLHWGFPGDASGKEPAC